MATKREIQRLTNTAYPTPEYNPTVEDVRNKLDSDSGPWLDDYRRAHLTETFFEDIQKNNEKLQKWRLILTLDPSRIDKKNKILNYCIRDIFDTSESKMRREINELTKTIITFS